VGNLFERLKTAPQPAETTELSQARKLQPAQALLTFLQRWSKSTVSEREIRIWGPPCLRPKGNANEAAEVLVRNGWLNRRKMRRITERGWEIVRKPILDPTVAP
jgi:hypothetical protein